MPGKRAQAEDRVFAGKVPTTFIMRKAHCQGNTVLSPSGRLPSQSQARVASIVTVSVSLHVTHLVLVVPPTRPRLRTSLWVQTCPHWLVRSRWSHAQGNLSPRSVGVLSQCWCFPPRPHLAGGGAGLSAWAQHSPPTRAMHLQPPQCCRRQGDVGMGNLVCLLMDERWKPEGKARRRSV